MLKFQQGFTMVEILIVITIVSMLAGLGYFMDLNILKSNIFSSDLNGIVDSIRRSRSEALNNIDNSAHGIKILPDSYVLFEGQNYDSRIVSKDQIIPVNSELTFSGLNEAVFTQLSGESTASGSIMVTEGLKTSAITINYDGGVNW